MSKAKHQDNKVFEERIKYLQLYLDHMMKENETLKQKLEDMKITAMHNKNMLKEYILSITNKDQIVEKLQCIIENLQERINSQDEYIKKKYLIINLA
jgi:predicted RNase H-like nuclease (RuvC/YqgF family)